MPKKRSNGEGSVFTRSDGRIIAQYMAGGKMKTHTVKTKDEGYRFLREVKTKMDRGEYVEPSAITVESWLHTWLKEYATPAVRPSTLASHQSDIRLHLMPALGRYRLQELRAEHVQAFINQQRRKGYAPSTIKRQTSVLKCALHQAYENQLIFRDCTVSVKLPKQEQKEIEFLTAEEIAALLPVLPSNTHGRALRFILGTGLRVSELCGLRWCDVSEAGLNVNQITYLLNEREIDEDEMKRLRICTPPKTKAGKRFIPFNDKLRSILDDQRRAQRMERIRAGDAWQGSEPAKGEQYIFATLIGTPADRHNLARTLRICLDAAHLTRRGVHALRHTFATNWVHSGADIRTLSAVLGHTNVAFTMQTYVHADNTTKMKGMEAMANLI